MKSKELHGLHPDANAVVKYPTAELDTMLAILDKAVDLTTPDSDYRKRVDLILDDVKKLRQALGSPLVSGLPKMTAHASATPVQIDGRLDDDAWLAATPQGMVLKNGEAPPYHSWLATTHDETSLYVGIANVEPQTDALRTLAGPDNPAAGIWDDDCIEVFIAPDADNPKRAYQIIVNAAGATWDGAYGLPEPGPGLFGCQPKWDCQGLRVAVSKTSGRWTAEVAIPFAALGLDGKALPPSISMNVFRCRSCNKSPIYTAWSPPLIEQHFRPERFGTVALDPSPATRPDARVLFPRSVDDVGSGAAGGPGWYAAGGILDGKPFVGNPNTLVRRDRMVIRFDLAPLGIQPGETGVAKAVLRLIPVSTAGVEDVRRLELSHLLYDTAVLSWKDVVDERTAVVAAIDAPCDRVCQDGLSFEVTAQVNDDMALGRPTAAFRLRDLGSEEGNADMKPDGLCFPPFSTGNLRLELEYR